ncbi:ComC/BlpC family leader-containing pheromone/bacteriocin [Myroides sp. NP-2]|nr:ComC/BlpC family leader-containing pheromone/bacteriocin [Myroides sp. NP-2]MBB1149088.1 ComC/BlpC family leader-containing pheromone/bacteriocin [Myroides sp. NP-2]
MKLVSLDQFKKLNEVELKIVKGGGLVAGSTVESDKRDDDRASTDQK